MTADATHYLRTREHYNNAPVGTVVIGAGGAPWIKESHFWWFSGIEAATSLRLAFVRRRIVRWGES